MDYVGELREFASVMVDEVIARTRVRLGEGQPLSLADQKHLLDQLIKDRARLASIRLATIEEAANVAADRAQQFRTIRDCSQNDDVRGSADQGVIIAATIAAAIRNLGRGA